MNTLIATATETSGVEPVTALLALCLLAFLYFLPSVVAIIRRHQVAAVIVLNLFLGWTIVGWVVALVLAVVEKNHPAVIVHNSK